MCGLFQIISDMITGIFDQKYSYAAENDVRRFFEAEYKRDANRVYQYWLQNNKLP